VVREVAGHRDAQARRARARWRAHPGLPIEDLQARRIGLGIEHEDVLRTERAVVQPFAMGEPNRLGDLAQEVEPRIDRDAIAALGEVVVQALGTWGVLEHQRGAALVLGVGLGLEDPRVGNTVEN